MDGGFGEYVKVEEHQLFRLPDHVSFAHGSLCFMSLHWEHEQPVKVMKFFESITDLTDNLGNLLELKMMVFFECDIVEVILNERYCTP